MSPMWVESWFDVGGCHVYVLVKRLDEDDGQRLSAEMAWFAQGLLTPGVDLDAIGWTTFLQQVLSEYVAITVDDDTMDGLEPLWTQVVCRADATAAHSAVPPRLRCDPATIHSQDGAVSGRCRGVSGGLVSHRPQSPLGDGHLADPARAGTTAGGLARALAPARP